jgi:hypothetical protein
VTGHDTAPTTGRGGTLLLLDSKLIVSAGGEPLRDLMEALAELGSCFDGVRNVPRVEDAIELVDSAWRNLRCVIWYGAPLDLSADDVWWLVDEAKLLSSALFVEASGDDYEDDLLFAESEAVKDAADALIAAAERVGIISGDVAATLEVRLGGEA